MGIFVGLEKTTCLSETVDEESLGGNALTTMMVACSVSRALVAQLVTPDFCFHCLHQTWWYGISRLPCPLRRQTQMRVCQLWIMQSRGGSKLQSGKFFIRHRSAFVIVIVVRCQISMWGVQRRSKSGTESFAELMDEGASSLKRIKIFKIFTQCCQTYAIACVWVWRVPFCAKYLP